MNVTTAIAGLLLCVMPSFLWAQQAAPAVTGINLGPQSYWTQNRPFIDMMKQADTRWYDVTGSFTTDYVGTDGWLQALPNGKRYGTIIYTSSAENTEFAYIRPGTYYATWSGNYQVTIQGVGTTNRRLVSPGRYAVDVSNGDGVPVELHVIVTNNTGGPVDVMGIKFFHADDEAALNAREIFQAHFLSALSGMKVLRAMNWFQVNEFGFDTGDPGFSDLPSIEFSHYNTERDRVWLFVPPSVVGKLGAKTGADIWVSLPVKCSSACMIAVANAIAPHYPSGKVYVEYGNELWNTAEPFNNSHDWLRDIKSVDLKVVGADGKPSIDENDRVACAMADGAIRAWSAFEAAFGRSRVVRVIAGFTYGWEIHAAAFEYIDPQSGQKVKNMADRYAIAPYFYITDGSGDYISLKYLLSTKAYNNPDSWWLTALRNDIDQNILPAVAYTQENLASVAPKVKLTMYEGGQHVVIAKWEEPSEALSFTINAANNTLQSDTDISALFDDGEEIYLGFNDGASPSVFIDINQRRRLFVKKRNNRELWLFLTQASYAADVNGRNALALDGPAQTYLADNYTRAHLIDKKIKAIFDGNAGKLAYEYWGDQMKGRFEVMQQYTESGTYAHGFQFGMKRSQFLPDTPRAQWYRSLGSAGR